MRRSPVRADVSSVRGWNEFVVVDSLRMHGPQRISDLVRTTGLTTAPLGLVLRSLDAKGWVIAGEPVVNGPGRPAQTFSLRRPDGWIVGLDIGAHVTRAVLVDLSGMIACRAERRVTPQSGAEGRHHAVAHVLAQCAPEPGSGDVWLTTLAVGGHLEPDGRVVRSVAIPEWDGRHPCEIFEELLPSPSNVVNDVRAATWAEHTVGAARGFGDVLVAQLGRRPTLGLLTNGVPQHGAHGTAGDMSLNTFLTTDQHMSWLEPFANSPDPLGDAVANALAGDAATLAAACGYVQSIAPFLAFAASVVDPAVFVVAGALSPLSDHFLDPLHATLEAHLQQPPLVVTSQLDQFAIALGAALLGLRTITDTLASATHGVAAFTHEEFAAGYAEALPMGQTLPRSTS